MLERLCAKLSALSLPIDEPRDQPQVLAQLCGCRSTYQHVAVATQDRGRVQGQVGRGSGCGLGEVGEEVFGGAAWICGCVIILQVRVRYSLLLLFAAACFPARAGSPRRSDASVQIHYPHTPTLMYLYIVCACHPLDLV